MSLVAAAVVPSAPLLVPALAGVSAAVDEVLRAHVLSVVREVANGPEDLVVVGPAAGTGPLEGTWDWSGFGVRSRGAEAPALPLSLAVGAWALDVVAPDRPRTFHGVAPSLTPDDCARLGRQLAQNRPLRLLVVGDGSARRTEKAPGHLDARAAHFDARVERALADGSPEQLLALEPDLATAVLAAGRAAWQVLAGAAQGVALHADLRHVDAPYGVGYLVALWTRG